VTHILSIDRANFVTGALTLGAGCVCLLTGVERHIALFAVIADALAPFHRNTVDPIEHEDAGRFTATHPGDVLRSAVAEAATVRPLAAGLVSISLIAVDAFATAAGYPATSCTKKKYAEGSVAGPDSTH